MRTLASEYGLSDVALAKKCKKLRIPVPGRGYWARKASGQRPRQKVLPTLPVTILTIEREVTFDLGRSERRQLLTDGPLSEQALFEQRPENKIVVGLRERSRDPLVTATRQLLMGTTSPSNTSRPTYDVDVAKESIPRAMRILSAIVKAFRVRGWQLRVPTEAQGQVSVTVVGQVLSFSLRERLRRVAAEPAKPIRIGNGQYYTPFWRPVEFVHTGRLVLQIDGWGGSGVRRSWADGKRQRVEMCLNDFMLGLVECAEESRNRQQEREQFAREWETARLQRIAEEEERGREVARITAFEVHAAHWAESRQLLEFLAALRHEEEQRPHEAGSSEIRDRWFAWATEHAEQLNPLRGALDVVWNPPLGSDVVKAPDDVVSPGFRDNS